MRAAAEHGAAFEGLRPRLLRVAYATLGSVTEAEDVVQEAWLRLERSRPGEIRELGAWATTVVGRLALDALTSARARRERYIGPWLPEPIVEDGADPADRVTLDEEVSMALLRMLERLSPAERTSFVLHDVFGLAFGEVAEVVGRTPEAARQLAARARRHVEAGRPRFEPSPDEQRRVVEAFAAAAAGEDLEGLVAVLDPEATLTSDGGGRVNAARRPVHGAARVARALLAFSRGAPPTAAAFVEVNGRPGLLVEGGGVRSVIAFAFEGRRIAAIDIVRNPDKLEHVRATPTPLTRPPEAR